MVPDPTPSAISTRARACFLWSTARSGTNIVTAALDSSPDLTCFNEDNPRAFEIFLLKDDASVEELLKEAQTPAVFFKCFGDTPRATHLMNRFEDARAIYLLRKPDETIASFVQEFGEMGRRAWATVFRSHCNGEPIHSFRMGGADPERESETRALSAEMVDLLSVYGETEHNVAATLYIWQHSFFLNYGSGPTDRVLLVRYADFTADPEQVYRNVCRWFDIRPELANFPKMHRGRGTRPEQGSPHPALLKRCEAIYDRICKSDQLTPLQAMAR